VRARAVRDHALNESVMVLTGEPFYVDRGGDHQLRICYTAQPSTRAATAAAVIARSIAAASRAAVAPATVRLV
jgi:DNA-binding transcriptional MocR family regulator